MSDDLALQEALDPVLQRLVKLFRDEHFSIDEIEALRTRQWWPIESAPQNESESFLVLCPGNSMARQLVIQVSRFQGVLYPDARDACIDWEDGIRNATYWMPLPESPK